MAVRSTQCQNKALRSTQGGGGVTLSTFHNASNNETNKQTIKQTNKQTLE